MLGLPVLVTGRTVRDEKRTLSLMSARVNCAVAMFVIQCSAIAIYARFFIANCSAQGKFKAGNLSDSHNFLLKKSPEIPMQLKMCMQMHHGFGKLGFLFRGSL